MLLLTMEARLRKGTAPSMVQPSNAEYWRTATQQGRGALSASVWSQGGEEDTQGTRSQYVISSTSHRRTTLQSYLSLA